AERPAVDPNLIRTPCQRNRLEQGGVIAQALNDFEVGACRLATFASHASADRESPLHHVRGVSDRKVAAMLLPWNVAEHASKVAFFDFASFKLRLDEARRRSGAAQHGNPRRIGIESVGNAEFFALVKVF